MSRPGLPVFRAAFDGIFRLSELKPLPASFCDFGRTHALFACPCGAKGHAATMAGDFDTGKSFTASPVLHCWETGRQWMVEKDVQTIIQREEEVFMRLMERFDREGLCGKNVTAVEAFRLHTERGCPSELLNVDSYEEFDRLMEEHRKISRA